jgi:hypothetical protein
MFAKLHFVYAICIPTFAILPTSVTGHLFSDSLKLSMASGKAPVT